MPLAATYSVAALTNDTAFLVLGPLPPRVGMVDLTLSIDLTDAFTNGRVLATITPTPYQPRTVTDAEGSRPYASNLALVANGSSASFSFRVPFGRFDRFVVVSVPVNNTLNTAWNLSASIAAVPGTFADRRRVDGDSPSPISVVPRPRAAVN
jgi:hypothetical protein